MANFSKPQSMMTMLVALFALLQFTVAFQHGAHHHAHRRGNDAIKMQIEEVADALEKRQSDGFTAITGVCTAGTRSNGACNGINSAPRLEIRQLRNNQDQWNLYLLGMERFQAKDKNDRLSYYQVAGIHGRPFQTWNNFPTPLVNQAGFCPHAQTLFGSWHRPYLAIYEQALYQSIQEVIDDFPSDEQDRLRDAASTLRMPYWDWAMDPGQNQPVVPALMRDQQVTVNKPEGRVTIRNPLYSYSFGDSLPDEIGGGPWNSWPITLRRPVGNPTRSNNNELSARFNAQRVSLRDRVFALFSSKQSWGEASTSQIGVRTDLSSSDSFESVHDAVHNTAGGESGGHMYYLDISSFDPLFWLHHTNIDRLLAMYQLIVPNTWVANGNINHPMAQWNQGEAKNGNTPLKPFTKDTAGNYFTSNDIRETRVLGYHYPETSDRSYSQVARAVTNLYGGGARTLSKRSTDEQTGQYLGRPLKEGDYHTVVEIIANKYSSGSYNIHCFVGQPGGNSTQGNSTAPYPVSNSTAPYSNSTGEADYDPSTDYTQQSNYVGSYGVLGGMKPNSHNSTYPVMTTGTLPLTSCLQGKEFYGELKSLKPEDVESYLAEHLHYKVVGVDGEINADDIPDLHISVKCTKVKPAANDGELPDLSAPYQKLPEATKNKPAGKPFTYKPTPIDIPLPEGPEYQESGNGNGKPPGYPSTGVFPYPTLPWEEQGYCATKQTVEYVDEKGNLLYAEKY
ncbi:Di-copper centre-containing protein [Cucurbitaria berberidis CBS 394.84]|uniref:tyrosinase n=1 Tax=Cucurbitaria berberidis CBS 394.84 TaxID=1168544 RepID=A0A9P4GEG7_9PLEO|nr:Di-copper centre-containing protein [Cucurbitaria berberidis CBS 394.84]KAF1844065.1 Di-copper centre-containing protein [Cucurbitaria berberidis CBS 394.84]